MTFLQRLYANSPLAHEKMLSITNPGEKQLKITVRYRFTPFRMAIIKKQKQRGRYGDTQIAVENVNCIAAVKNSLMSPE